MNEWYLYVWGKKIVECQSACIECQKISKKTWKQLEEKNKEHVSKKRN